MKKKILILSLFAFLALFITGCGVKKITPTTTATTTKTTTIQKEWTFDYKTDNNKLVLNFNNLYYLVFNFAGDKVVDMWYVYDFKDIATANSYVAIYKAQYKDDANRFK